MGPARVGGVPRDERTRSVLGLLWVPSILLAAGLLSRALVLTLSPPLSDVYYVDDEAVRVLLAGQNPYSHTFVSIPAWLETPGAARVFAYLPFSVFFLIPSWLAGDVRFGLIFADLVVGVAVYFMRGRWSLPLSAVFLLAPFTVLLSTIYMNNLLIAISMLSLFVLFESRGMTHAGAVMLGLALASSQLAWLVLPFGAYVYLRSRRRLSLVIALATSAVFILPFLLASPQDFVSDTILFQFGRSTMPVFTSARPDEFTLNLALAAVLTTLLHVSLPVPFRLGVVLLALPLSLWGVVSLNKAMLRAAIFSAFAVFVLPNNLFWAYAELPLVALLLAVASRETREPINKLSHPKT